MWTFSRRDLRGLAVRVVLLGAIYYLVIPGIIAAVPWPVGYAIALILRGNIMAVPNLVWFAVLAGVLIAGLRKKERQGIASAPLAFAALCLIAALTTRIGTQVVESRGDWSPAIPAEAKGYRTLIIDDWYEVRPNIVANHAVDRLVEVTRNSNTHKIEKIVEIRLGKGDECSAEERARSPDLMKAGRIDECYKRQQLDAVPDGLVIAYHGDVAYGHAGCCDASEVRRRDNGQETTLVAWRQGFVWVASYVPIYAIPTAPKPTGIWQPDSAPWQLVRYGRADIEPPTLAAAIYGADAVSPPKLPDLTTEEVLDKAEKLAAEPTGNPQAVIALLTTVKEQGPVNERAIRIAASLIGHGEALDDNVLVFQWKLTPAQTEQLIADALDRIETPGICQTCYGSATRWSMLYQVPDAERYTDRARRIFEERSDLAFWQYEAALRIATAHLLYNKPEFDRLRSELFSIAAAEMSTPTPGPRAAAFKRVLW